MTLTISCKVWTEGLLEQDGRKYIQLHDSISEEELRRFVDMDLLGVDRVFYKDHPETFIRPRVRDY